MREGRIRGTMANRILAASLAMALWAPGHAAAITDVSPAGFEADDAELFKPTVDPGPFLSVYDTRTLPHGRFAFGYWQDYANEAFDARQMLGGKDQNVSFVDHLSTLNMVASVGVLDRLQLGLHFPLYVTSRGPARVTGGESGGTDFNLGDVLLNAKVDLLPRDPGRTFGLALVPTIALPSGNHRAFAGTGDLSGGGLLAAEFRIDEARVGVNFGGMVRDGAGGRGTNDRLEDLLRWGVALNAPIAANAAFIGELYGTTDAGSPFSDEFHSPVELLGAVRFAAGPVDVTIGAGGGLNSGKNDARFRMVAGITSAGARGPRVEPPDLRGSRNGYVVEDYDRNGQVSPGDVIVYTITLNNAGTTTARNLIVIDPIPANTQYVPDSTKWNDQPVEDGAAYASGPPRIELRVSSLPAAPGANQQTVTFKVRIRSDIPSLLSVRNEARIDADGMTELRLAPIDTAVFPTTVQSEHVVETPLPTAGSPQKLGITQNIQFELNSANLRSESLGVLDEVVGILRDHPELELMIVGHTDSKGGEGANLRLSQDRADAVKQYFVNRGIAGSRLQSIGRGGSEPIASSDTEGGRQTNRRVDFVALKGTQ